MTLPTRAQVALAFSVTGAWAVTFRVVAKTGDLAPGTGGAAYNGFGNPALNDAGETVFFGSLTGDGGDRRDRLGHLPVRWRRAAPLVERGADTIDLGHGDIRMVSRLGVGCDFLNDPCQIAFLAGFTDGRAPLIIADKRDAGHAVVRLPAPMALLRTGPFGLGPMARPCPAQAKAGSVTDIG